MHPRHTFSPVYGCLISLWIFSDCVDSFYFIRNSERLWLPIKISLATLGLSRTTLLLHTTRHLHFPRSV